MDAYATQTANQTANQAANQAPQAPNQAVPNINRNTPAAKWNASIMEKLQRELDDQPDGDIRSILGTPYSTELLRLRALPLPLRHPPVSFPPKDIRLHVDEVEGDAIFVHGPAPELEACLYPGGDHRRNIIGMLWGGDVLSEPGSNVYSRLVVRMTEAIVCKITDHRTAENEYLALALLAKERPNFPAPRPFGVVHIGHYGLVFRGYMGGTPLSKTWPRLTDVQKGILSDEIDMYVAWLRQIPRPPNTALGDLGNGGCRDGRRGNRPANRNIMTPGEFDEWMLSSDRHASPVYRRFVKTMLDMLPTPQVYFTHGDLCPGNLIVEKHRNYDTYHVFAVLDWEDAGFYPDYWESAMLTKNMGRTSESDWYNYLPPSLSPPKNFGRWMLSRFWDLSST